MAGIPTTCVTREGFEEVLANAFAGFGFPAEATISYVFPTEMFLEGSDLTPLEEHMDDLLNGLVTWQPQSSTLGMSETQMVEVEGSDYADACAKLNNVFIRNQWTDGMPFVPPTEELVNWILTGTDMDPDDYVNDTRLVMPRGGLATVRACAVCLAMAGGRPEYLPFLIAAVAAMIDTNSYMQSWTATTNSTIPAFVVDGPAARQIRLSHGYGLLGPDPLHPAGQILGRAVRLIQQDLGGALPGVGTMAIYGGSRVTNAFFAEDTDDLPEGWTTWAEDRGYSTSDTVVTLTETNSMYNVYWEFGDADANIGALNFMSDVVGCPNPNRYPHIDFITLDNDDLDTGLILMPKAFVTALAGANGMSKEDTKAYIWENSQEPYEMFEKNHQLGSILKNALWADKGPGDRIPVCPKASQLTIVVCGGSQGGHGYFLGPVTQGNVTDCKVQLPKNWDDLLLDAEIDLGAIPAE